MARLLELTLRFGFRDIFILGPAGVLQKVFGPDRQISHPFPSRMEYRVGDGSVHADDSYFADPLDAERIYPSVFG
jgi:hypothetical protein